MRKDPRQIIESADFPFTDGNPNTSVSTLHTIFHWIAWDRSLKDFLNHCEQLLGSGIWIMDAAFNLLESSDKAQQIWRTTFENGTKLDALIDDLKQEQLFQTINSTRKPLIHLCAPLNMSVIVSDIYINQERVAKLTAFDVTPDEIDWMLVSEILDGVSIMIQKLDYLPKREDYQSQFLYRLLQDPPLQEHELHNYLRHGNLYLEGEKQIVLLTDLNQGIIDQPDSIPFLIKQIKKILPGCIGTRYQNQCILLISGVDFEDDTNDFFDYLRTHHLNAYFSNSFYSFTHLKEYYRQAQFTLTCHLKTKKPSTVPSIHTYRTVYLTDLLTLAGEHSELESICNPALKEILSYDQTHHTNYLETLWIVYCQSTSREDAAKQLNLHVNTIKYRLSQIEELFGLKIDSYEDRFYLHISMEILRLI